MEHALYYTMINPWDSREIFHLQSAPRLLINHLSPKEREADSVPGSGETESVECL